MRTNVVVNLQYEALHYWKEAASFEKEVSFLEHPHRHLFYITCKKAVNHDDRDVEIILLKRTVIGYLKHAYGGNFGGKSCEMVARELLERFDFEYCLVLEDGENGAEVWK